MSSTMVDSSIPQLDIDHYSDEFQADPYPFYAEMREAGPVLWLTRYEIYALPRYAEVAQAIADWENFTTNRGFGLVDRQRDTPLVDTPEYKERFTGIPSMHSEGMRLLMDAWRPDPPESMGSRKVLSRIVTPKAVRELRERFTREAEEVVDRVVARGSFDAATDLAEAYVLKMLCDVAGMPERGRELLLPYGDMTMNTSGPRDRRYMDSIERAVPAVDWVEAACRRDRIAPGTFGARMYELADRGEITEEEASFFVRVFPIAGVDTTSSTITNAIYHLIRNPDQWRLLREDPSLSRKAFQETVRYDLPPHPLYRTTSREVEIAGATLAEGRKVLLLLASANRDPRRFEDPDRFDIRRDATGHIGFGKGMHSCLGQMLATLEGECLLGALAERVESMALDGEPERRANNTIHTWSRLPVTVRVRG